MKPIVIMFLGLCLIPGAHAQSVTLSQLFAFPCQQTLPGFCSDGAKPVALIQASDGNFYGVTETSYASHSNTVHLSGGTIFKITASGQLTLLYTFQQNPKTDTLTRERSPTLWRKEATGCFTERRVVGPTRPAQGHFSESANPAPASRCCKPTAQPA